MKIIVLCVGRLRSAPLREICADYLSRLQHYGPAEVLEVKASENTSANAVAQESTRLLQAIQPTDRVFALDERGEQVSSIELSRTLAENETQSVKRAVFVIGGAYGMDAAIKKRGKLLSLSKMTLPHELCRAILFEQLYRARTIQRGEPYHHGDRSVKKA